MSRPWRLATAIGLFVVAVVGIIFAVIALAKEPPTVDYAAGHQSGQPVDRDHADRRVLRIGQPPHLGLVPDPRRRRASGSTPRFGRFRPTPGSTSRSTTTTQVARCAISRSARSPGPSGNSRHAQRQADPAASTPTPATASAHTFSIPTLGINVPALREQPQRQPVRGGAVHHAARPTGGQGSPSSHPARDSTRGSASCPAAWDSSMATVGRCKPSGTWTAS